MAKQFLRTDNTTKRIVRVEFVREVDDSPDLSYLGEYSNSPSGDAVTIDREERGDMGRGEFRYFIAGMSPEDTGNPSSVEEDYKRMESMNRGDWCMLFCQARAQISINGVMQRVTSGGLGGVESDSGDDYFDEIKGEQLEELREILKSMGFRAKQIDAAFAECQTVE